MVALRLGNKYGDLTGRACLVFRIWRERRDGQTPQTFTFRLVRDLAHPHRPGHLLRLQKNGLLFRTTVANTASPAVLNSADAWDAVDPFFGKTGLTTTMAFRSRVLEERPIYYLGTDSGQVWRGSPEAGWTKLCECGAAINAIAPDLFQNERIFVALQGSSSPGRVKELLRQPNGAWAARNIDAAFTPDLDVLAVTSVVVDPAVIGTRGTTIYVGTDQGVYRGHVDPLVLDPSPAAFALLPPVFGDWAWQRSPGVPNVWVTDLEVHQNFQGRDRSGVVRAGTYGRGIFELTRISGPRERPPLVLSVQALQLNDDGAPSYLNVPIPVQVKDQKLRRDTPFELTPPKGTEVSLEAPREFRRIDRVLKFAGWVIPGRPPVTGTKVSLRVDMAVRAVAYYENDRRIPDPKAAPLRVAVSARAQQMCLQEFTHSVVLSWEIGDGRRPVSLFAEMTYPDRTLNRIELKHFEGSQEFPISSSQGGKVRIKVTATDSAEAHSSAETNVELKPCR